MKLLIHSEITNVADTFHS